MNKTIVRELFTYDGVDLRWRIRPSERSRAREGDIAGGIMEKGYIGVGFLRKRYYAHRLIWLYVYGVWPNEIDHINGVKGDNRITNLRDVTHSTNQKNRRLSTNNTSGVIGVSWDQHAEKWGASIRVDGKNTNLGIFNDKQDAITARRQAEIKYNFHPNHGNK